MKVTTTISIAKQDSGAIQITADGKSKSYTGSENIIASQYDNQYGVVANTVIMKSLLDPTIEYKFSIDQLTTINGSPKPNNLPQVLSAINGVFQSSSGFPGNGTGNQVVLRTGTEIIFDKDSTYGSIDTPETDDITLAGDAEFTPGIISLIIHNSSPEPTYPSEFKKRDGSADYVEDVNNFIVAECIDEDNIIYSISQIAP